MKEGKIFIRLFIIGAVFLMAGCGDSSDERENGQTRAVHYQGVESDIRFEMRHFLKESDLCREKEDYCARVEAHYLEAVEGPPELLALINDTISHYLRESLSVFATTEDEILTDLNAIADRFITDYEDYAREIGDYPVPWEIRTDSDMLFQSPKVISLKMDNYSFTGGAHPMGTRILLNFDLQDRDMLYLDEVVRDIGKLKRILEAKFRAFHQIEDDANLNEAGFFWDQSFFLPQNFAVDKDGLYFYYNSYEAAPYAAGTTEILVLYEELKDIINQEKIL